MNLQLLFLSFFLAITTAFSQTLVDTEPAKKNFFLEKFTGVGCGFCPDGDDIIDGLEDQWGDRLNTIAYHTFSSSGIYNTTYGHVYADSSFCTGYPGGNINRLVTSNQQVAPHGTAMGRGSWEPTINTIKNDYAYVNIGVEFLHYFEVNKYKINVELYYTGTPGPNQRLNVALIQDGILGDQAGSDLGSSGEYEHNHMLRDMLTGQWGEPIENIVEGELITKTFDFVMPDAIGAVEVVPENMSIIVYVSELDGIVENSEHASPELAPSFALNSYIKDQAVSVCGETVDPIVEIGNYGSQNLTELEITYAVNGEEYVYDWTGDLAFYETETVTLPSLTYTPQASNTFTAEITNTNNLGVDDTTYNNAFSIDFETSVENAAHNAVKLKLDGWGSDITWSIVDNLGNTHLQGGPYADGTIDLIYETVDLDADLCYTFSISDSEGNGLQGGQDQSNGTTYPPGYYEFISNGQVVKTNVNFGEKERQFFSIDLETVGTEALEANTGVSLTPNPSSSFFNLDIETQMPGQITYTIMELTGRIISVHQVDVGEGKNTVEVNHDLPIGMYHVEVRSKDYNKRIPFVVSH
ncbi:MAG: Omp28-related outer membrane protein [Flavobacteriales bacterium]